MIQPTHGVLNKFWGLYQQNIHSRTIKVGQIGGYSYAVLRVAWIKSKKTILADIAKYLHPGNEEP